MPLAIAGLVAGSIGAIATAGASKNAAKATQQAADTNNALQTQIYNNNVGLSQPYIDRGNQASTLISNFLGLSGDPAKAKAAMQTYLDSTGYNFRLNEGVKAITSNRAASGILDSGATLKAITNYGQNVAQSGANDWLSQLLDVSHQGVGAIGAVTGAGTGYANAVSANNTAAADAKANASLAGANSINGLLGNALGAFAYGQGASSYSASKTPSFGIPESLVGLV